MGEGAILVTTERFTAGRAVIEAGADWAEGADARVGAHSTRARLAKAALAGRTLARTEALAQAERWTLWAPVAMGLGAAVYLGLPREPVWPVAAALLASTVVAAFAAQAWGRSRALAISCALLAFGAAGFAAGVAKSRWIAAPVAPASSRPVTLEGWVVDVVSADASRPRLLIAPTRLGGLSPEETPRLVRVSLRPGDGVGPGQAVRVSALMGPPPPPAAPGAYDFARDAWFSGVGGSGLSLRAPEPVSLRPPPFWLGLELRLNAARWSLARRLVDRMGPREGGLAAALVTGHQPWLDPGDVQAMRDSGLAHILSISGVHMAIVGGFAFALARLLVAAWPWLALRAPGKKIAAVAGLLAVGGYLVLSGAPAPAIRSALTASIAFLAVVLDRRALSLHSLAVAAMVVLAAQPEAVAQPGFQMSFAATAALLALAEAWRHGPKAKDAPWPIRFVQHARDWLVGGALVSLVAGLATDPFGIQHFNRVTLWGLPANIATELLSSLVIMPALAVGVLAELAGWGGAPLAVAGWGLDAMTAVARGFAAAPHAVVGMASAPAAALPTSFLGLLFTCLWKGRLRVLGLPFFAAVWLWPRAPTPDVWIAPEGANVAVAAAPAPGRPRGAVRLRPRSQAFAFQLWAHRRGLVPLVEEAAQTAADARFDCGRSACTPTAAAEVRLAQWWGRRTPPGAEVERLCASADLIVLRRGTAPDGQACRGRLVLDESALTRGGAAELWRVRGGWRVVWAQDGRGDRPWTAPSGSDG